MGSTFAHSNLKCFCIKVNVGVTVISPSVYILLGQLVPFSNLAITLHSPIRSINYYFLQYGFREGPFHNFWLGFCSHSQCVQ